MLVVTVAPRSVTYYAPTVAIDRYQRATMRVGSLVDLWTQYNPCQYDSPRGIANGNSRFSSFPRESHRNENGHSVVPKTETEV